jgi:excisionase family DNA binding protein
LFIFFCNHRYTERVTRLKILGQIFVHVKQKFTCAMENPFATIVERLDDLDYKLSKLLRSQEAHGLYKSDELMNISELAEFIDESVQSIYARTSQRTIPFYKKGKKLLFKKSEILDWLETRKKKTVSELVDEI